MGFHGSGPVQIVGDGFLDIPPPLGCETLQRPPTGVMPYMCVLQDRPNQILAAALLCSGGGAVGPPLPHVHAVSIFAVCSENGARAGRGGVPAGEQGTQGGAPPPGGRPEAKRS